MGERERGRERERAGERERGREGETERDREGELLLDRYLGGGRERESERWLGFHGWEWHLDWGWECPWVWQSDPSGTRVAGIASLPWIRGSRRPRGRARRSAALRSRGPGGPSRGTPVRDRPGPPGPQVPAENTTNSNARHDGRRKPAPILIMSHAIPHTLSAQCSQAIKSQLDWTRQCDDSVTTTHVCFRAASCGLAPAGRPSNEAARRSEPTNQPTNQPTNEPANQGEALAPRRSRPPSQSSLSTSPSSNTASLPPRHKSFLQQKEASQCSVVTDSECTDNT